MTSSRVDSLKELGNQAFEHQKYRDAIRTYTQGLEAADDTVPIETKRILLANRAQAFVSYGSVVHEALRDLNQALSPAKLLCTIARYDEALDDFDEFASITTQLGQNISCKERKLKKVLVHRASADEDSDRRRRDELMRAIDARGFILRQSFRERFPEPPPDTMVYDFDWESQGIIFDTADEKPDPDLPEPSLTPISIPITIRAPYFYDNPDNPRPYSTRRDTPVSEDETIVSTFENLFSSVAAFSGYQATKQSMHLALDHDEDGVVIMVSSRGRIFKLPRNMKLKDIVAGARWPRPPDAPDAPVLEDLRRAPRRRSDEIDGIEVSMGWMLELYVIPEYKLEAFTRRLETSFPFFEL